MWAASMLEASRFNEGVRNWKAGMGEKRNAYMILVGTEGK
jgi:hypothetical protein